MSWIIGIVVMTALAFLSHASWRGRSDAMRELEDREADQKANALVAEARRELAAKRNDGDA